MQLLFSASCAAGQHLDQIDAGKGVAAGEGTMESDCTWGKFNSLLNLADIQQPCHDILLQNEASSDHDNARGASKRRPPNANLICFIFYELRYLLT